MVWLGPVGYVLFIIGLLVLVDSVSKLNKMFCIVVFLILGMFFEAIGIKAGYEAQISQIYRNFSREVDFRRVTMKGQNNFRAQIEIIYKDGELDRIILVPKTTVPVEAKVEESKDKESEIKK